MISATSLSSASSPHSLNKSAQIPLGLENGRLRVDSQKFLVPSLPVSARALSNDPSSKRRERSILNGTAHPSHSSESHSSSNLNGLRRSYSGSQLHQPQLHTSPRKDAQSPMYNGESNGAGMPTNPSNFLVRSSMPIPCSSPSPGTSASPNKSHSPSSSLQSSNNASGSYTPQLPPGLSDLNLSSPAAAAAAAAAASRLYPGGFHGLASHSAAAHLSPYYAAAAAAATHSLPYPIFGAHSYNPHSGSSYLDNFHHSNLLAVPQMRTSSSQSPPRPTSSYIPPQVPQQHSPHLPGPHTTSTTSLHNQLIESVGSGERYNGHNHNHLNNHLQHHHHPHTINSSNNNSRFSNGGPGVSKASPKGVANTISTGSVVQNLPPLSVAQQHKVEQHQGVAESSSDKSFTSGNNRNKVWIDSPSPKGSTMANGNVSHLKEMEVDPKDPTKVPYGKEGSLKHHILTRSPDNLTPMSSATPHKNLHFANQPASNESSPSGVLVDSNAKLNNQISSNSNPFLPPSPKNRSGQWNFVVPNSKLDLPPPSSHPPPSPSANPTGDSLKYLSNQTKNPSNTLTSNNSGNIINHSPKSPYLMTPPSSTSAQQFHFQFPNLKSTIHSNSNSPKNSMSGNQSPAAPYLPAPSTPTLPPSHHHHNSNGTAKLKSTYSNSIAANKLNPNHPLQMEHLPLIDAFHRGSLTQLPNGDLIPVEDLSAEDFIAAANFLSDSISILHCTVISIHVDTQTSLSKVIMTMGSQNQQVVVETSAGQPFFVVGRGWSSSSPALTEKRLQLQCAPLCVGDACITLQRNLASMPMSMPTPAIATTTTSSPPANTVVPKSPSVKQNGKGNSYNSSASNSSPKAKQNAGNTTKGSSSRLASSSSNNNTKSNRRLANSNSKPLVQNGNAKAMLPPPTPPPPSNLHSNSNVNNNTYHHHNHHHPQNNNISNHHQQQQQQQQQQYQQQQFQAGQPLSLTVSKRSPPMTDENDRPSSPNPKKRRWSAPDQAINGENDSHVKIQV